MVAPTIKGTSTSNVDTDGGTTNLVNYPAGAAAGDLFLTASAEYGSAGAISASTATGFTQIATSADNTVNNTRGTLLGRVRDGSEGAQITHTHTGAAANSYWTVGALVVQNADVSGGLVSAINAFSQSNGNSTGPAIVQVTTTVADCGVFLFIETNQQAITSTTLTGGWTMIAEWDGSPGFVKVFYKAQASAGATGTPTVTFAGASDYTMQIVALAPAAGGSPTAPAQVTGFTATTTRARRVALAWTAPSDGGSAITDYLIERAPDVGGSPGTYTTIADGTSTTTSYTDYPVASGLAASGTYWYRVSAINAIGTGTASAADDVVVTNHPGIKSSNTQQGTSLSAAANFTLPTSAAAGDLVIYFISSDATGGTAITGSTGWTELTNSSQTITSNVHHAKAFGRVLDGTSGDNILNPNGAAQDYTCIGICVDKDEHSVTNALINSQVIVAGTFSASNGSADPPNCNPGSIREFLWLAYATIDKSASGNNITASPANFGQVATSDSAASTTSSYAWLASRRTEAASLDPGTFTNTARPWIAMTVAIPPCDFLVYKKIPVRIMGNRINSNFY